MLIPLLFNVNITTLFIIDMGGRHFHVDTLDSLCIILKGMEIQLGKFSLDFHHAEGFRLSSYSDVFAAESYSLLQKAFAEVAWFKKDTYFYTQYKSYVEPSDKHALARLYRPSFFFPFKARLEKALGVGFQNKIRVIAHKLITEDEIGVHNDYSDPEIGCENFRFVFQFAEPGQLISGGELTFLSSRTKEDVIKQYSYSANTGICFEITPRSFHFVTAVNGERHTMVVYLWGEGHPYDGSGTEVIGP